jgi:hypothetical protein
MHAPCPRCSRSDANCLALPGGWTACKSGGIVDGWLLVRGNMYRPIPAAIATTVAPDEVQPAVVRSEEPPSPPMVPAEPGGDGSDGERDDGRSLAEGAGLHVPCVGTPVQPETNPCQHTPDVSPQHTLAATEMPPDPRTVTMLCAWVQRRGDRVTIRDLQESHGRKYRSKAAAEAAINALVAVGLGTWSESVPPGGGWRHKVFTLALPSPEAGREAV